MQFERAQSNKKEISKIRQPIFIIFEIVIVIFDKNHENVSHISIQTSSISTFLSYFSTMWQSSHVGWQYNALPIECFHRICIKKELPSQRSPVEKEAIILSTNSATITSNAHQQLLWTQGSYRSWKTGKVLEFYSGIFQDWKVLEKGYWSWKDLKIC